ncbi:MAG: ABC transporter ATP-binding protein [Candidatus Thorarchaeota archaeon]|nr:ABC transporter ATP-binding protein [Candidatus Thorarchaeota archaeon]
MALVEVQDVWKTYYRRNGQQVHALRGVTLKIEEGHLTGIAGSSGSGKTTLLSLIGLLSKPSSGSISIDGIDVSGMSDIFRSRMRREKIGQVFQSQYLVPHLTAVENVALPKMCTDISRSAAERQAVDILEHLDMGHRLHFRVAELSGGELQRVSIARALINSPKVVLADEPSSAIDESLTLSLLRLLKGMCKDEGLTVVVASHDPIVLKWADRIHRLDSGKLLENGTK